MSLRVIVGKENGGNTLHLLVKLPFALVFDRLRLH